MGSFRPGEIWPDTDGAHINAHGGGVLRDDGVYYWFGEHKVEGRLGNKAMVGVGCYSSTDLCSWENEGIALPVVMDHPDHELTQGCVLERPKVIRNQTTGEYVMWFHLELKDQGYTAARAGVAVSDCPTGPYTYLGSMRPDESMSRDMTLHVDGDQAAYHIYASEENATLHISRLTDDYRAPSGEFKRVFENRSIEAPAILRHGGRYYFIASGCTGWAPNEARSAVADSIWGPWEELGNPCVGPHAELTFLAQSTYVLPVRGKPGAFIFMADRWRPENAIDGRYVWLPIQFRDGRLVIEWMDEWDLSLFDA